MIDRATTGTLGAGAAMLSVLLLAACATGPATSVSTKGDLAFDVPEDLCRLPDPTPEQMRLLQARPDYADILVAIGRACPDRLDVFGIGPTASIPSLTMVQEDGSRGLVLPNFRSTGREVDPPDVPGEEDPGVVVDPPAEPVADAL